MLSTTAKAGRTILACSIVTVLAGGTATARTPGLMEQAGFKTHTCQRLVAPSTEATRKPALAAKPTAQDDFVFRFEAGPADASGVQPITLTVFKDGMPLGTHTGATTAIAASKAGNITTNTGSVGGIDVKYFIGPRADSFSFDVVRFFQVRAFLAQRFFGGPGGIGDASATLAPNCRGDKFLALGASGEAGGVPDNDVINLFNPPSCAPDFTKNLNVTAIVLNVPIAELGGGAIFDTWSTISVSE